MCQSCEDPSPRGATRRSFLGQLAGAAAAVALGRAPRLVAADAAPGGVAKAGWARVITPNREWDFHNEREARFLRFLENDPQAHYNGVYFQADPTNLADLCRSPFLFTFDLASLYVPKAWENLREYLYRGGFLFLDNCVHVSPNIRRYRQDHLERLTKLLPASEWRRLSPDHPIYRTRYTVDLKQLPRERKLPPEEERAFYGVFDDNRMVALVSVAHLFCGWPEQPSIVEPCMRQLANIYVYSRIH